MTSPIPAAALDGALAIIGATGAGKTFAAKGAVEQLLMQDRRVCIIDPLDVWYGLRTSADGAEPWFPVVVFGGDHADIPIGVDEGAALARIIAAGEGDVRSSIICTANMTGGETARFLTPFFETLFAENRTALHLVIDEADAFAPQSPMPEAMRMKGAVDKIARRGRVKGFRLLTITQRPAVLDKSVLSQIATLVAMKLTSAQDRKAIEAWIKGSADEEQAKAVLGSLAKLGRGEGWIWSPAAGVLERVAFPAISTLDTSRTPEHGEAVVEARAAATVDIGAIRAALVALAPPQPDPKTSPDRQPDAGAALRIDEIPAGSPVPDAGLSETNATAIAAVPTRRRKDAGPEGNHRPLSGAGPKPSAVASADGALNSAARKMLAVLDTNPPVRRSWQQVATLAGLKARGGHFNTGKKALVDGGLVVEDGGLVLIANPTPGVGEPPTPAEIVERWAGVLSGAAPKILRFLFGEHPLGYERNQGSREWIAAELGMQPRGGHWNAAWKELRDNGLVEIDGSIARLHPAIFGGRL